MLELAGAWTQLFKSIVGYTAFPTENLDDIVAGGYALGYQRSAIMERPFEIWQDIPHGLVIFCWWPFKPALYDDETQAYIFVNRGRLFAGASTDTEVRAKIIDRVPKDLLALKDIRDMPEYFRGREISSILRIH